MTGGIEAVIDEELSKQTRAGQRTMISKQRIQSFFHSLIEILMSNYIFVSLMPLFQRQRLQ